MIISENGDCGLRCVLLCDEECSWLQAVLVFNFTHSRQSKSSLRDCINDGECGESL
jgi:hypothetical protein